MANRIELKENEGQQNNKANYVRVNGYQQVLDLLRAADPDFRESLLRRIERHDYELGASLRERLYSQVNTP